MKQKLKPFIKKFSHIVNRVFFVSGFDQLGKPKQKWCVMDKLNNTIQSEEKKLNKTIDVQLGDLVVHREHPLGIGLVVEKHPKHNAYRVQWIDHERLDLFIAESVLCPINKERTHESDDL